MSILDKLEQFNAGKVVDDNPFQQEGNTLFCKFDKIILINAADGSGLQVGFHWRDNEIAWMPVPDVRFEDNRNLTLGNIEGRQSITIQTA